MDDGGRPDAGDAQLTAMDDAYVERPSIRPIAYIVGLAFIALLAGFNYYTAFRFALVPSTFGDFGLSVDFSQRVSEIRSGSSAARAGLQVGDTIDSSLPLRDRYLLFWDAAPSPGESVAVVAARGSDRRTVTLIAAPTHRSIRDDVVEAIITIAAAVTLMVGIILALARPGMMTLGFFVFAAGLANQTGIYPNDLPAWALVAFVVALNGVLLPAGACGLLVFCLRFPLDDATGWRAGVERAAPAALVALTAFQVAFVLGQINQATSPQFLDAWSLAVSAIVVVTGLGGAITLLDTYRRSAPPERERVKWVVFGLACTAVAMVSTALAVNASAGWIVTAGEALEIALPLSVAYAVLRHRVIDVRFVVSRALVLGVIAFAVGAIVIALDWAFSTRFANSPAETAIYAGIALVVGLALNTVRQRVGTLVDSVFFRRWQATQTKADAVDASLRRAATRPDLYGPLTDGVASAFSIASVALFERLADGGYLRVAAVGWPRKMLWHILPDSSIARGANALRPANVETFVWAEHAVPAGVARPTLVVPIVAGRQPAAILVCGAHENGTALDPDEIRVIRRLCADAAPVYAQTMAGVERSTFTVDRRGLAR
ncbi:MAG TPA: hypothetical protein VID24_04120 [Candidatus Eremiobacteraceae bacterium]|jgi:hypothetical protein